MNEMLKGFERAVRETFGSWLHPVQHADVVLQLPPAWATAKTIRALTGLNREQLNRFASERKVTAKRIGGSVVYRYSDVLAVIEAAPER